MSTSEEHAVGTASLLFTASFLFFRHTLARAKSQEQLLDTNDVYDCVIVGAGLAGLSAAAALVSDHGYSADGTDKNKKRFLIVEAQSYIGGRIKQDTSFIPGINVDVGAELMHGSETILGDIAREDDLHTKKGYVWAQGDGT